MLLRNELNSFLITIPSAENDEEYLDLSVNKYNATKIDIELLNGSPHIQINVPLSAKIASIGSNSNYLKNNKLKQISNYAKSYLESNISSYLYKTSKEFNSDINGFGKTALKHFSTVKEWEQYNWQEHYKDAFFSVNVDIDVKSSLLLTETYN